MNFAIFWGTLGSSAGVLSHSRRGNAREKCAFGPGAHAPSLPGCPIELEERGQVESVPHDAADHGEEPGEAVAPLGVAKFPAATQRRPMGYTVNKHKSHEAGKALGCSADVGEVGSVY